MSRLRLRDVQPQLHSLERRLFLRNALSLGAVTMLAGCDLSDGDAFDRVLSAMSRWNDKVQAALFNPHRLAPTFAERAIADPFPFNAYYEEAKAPVIDTSSFRLELSGRIADKRPWSVAELRQLPQATQVTRHICVEGWSAIGKWGGVPFRTFLERVGADLRAPFVGFKCADDYYSSIDMATALHPQTLLALDWRDAALPAKYGSPMKLRVPTKLGFKNPKHITAIFVTDANPGGYWEDQGYNWFSGL